jgi:hypothetical protein
VRRRTRHAIAAVRTAKPNSPAMYRRACRFMISEKGLYEEEPGDNANR